MLDWILREIRDCKREVRAAYEAAYEEYQQLEQVLAALDAETPGGAGRGRSKGESGRAGAL